MKLCFIADASTVHAQRWISYFVEQGHDVDVITFLWHDLPGAKVHWIKPPLGFNLFEKQVFSRKLGYLALIPGIRRLVRQLQPDILHAHRGTSYGLVGAMAGYHPFILSTWGYDVQWRARDNRVYEKMVRFNLSRADVITSTSINLMEDTKALSPPDTPIFTVPFGIDCDLFKPMEKTRSAERPLTIGLVKRLEEKCQVQDLIAAFALLKPRLNHIRLMIVGEGAYQQELKAQVHRFGLEESVIFTGWVENSQLPGVINQFDVFALPTYPESFGVAVLEALACGVPVVATNVGGLPEVMREGRTGYLISPGAPEEMADSLYDLLADDEKRLQMGRNGRQFVLDHYKWEDNAAMMARIYEQVLNGEFR